MASCFSLSWLPTWRRCTHDSGSKYAVLLRSQGLLPLDVYSHILEWLLIEMILSFIALLVFWDLECFSEIKANQYRDFTNNDFNIWNLNLKKIHRIGLMRKMAHHIFIWNGQNFMHINIKFMPLKRKFRNGYKLNWVSKVEQQTCWEVLLKFVGLMNLKS